MLSEKPAELVPQPTVLVYHGESVIVLSPASCGMDAAMGIGVMREHGRGFLWYLWRGGYTLGDWGVGARLVRRAAVENAVRERRVILSADLPWGDGNRWVAAQRIGGGAV